MGISVENSSQPRLEGSSVLLRVENLTVNYTRGREMFPVLEDISFELPEGRILGIVGESGSGKSTLASIILGLAERIGAKVVGGEVSLGGKNLLTASRREIEEVRRNELGFIGQDPHSALDPAFTIRNQVLEAVAAGDSGGDHRSQALEVLRRMRFPDPEGTWGSYPHELSGGMKQRAAGAIGIVNQPSLLIADEPTTALDVTSQSEYLGLLRYLRDTLGVAIIIISHDFGVIAETCDDVMVMYAGRIVEHAPVRQLFDAPQHPYTSALLECRIGAADTRGKKLKQIVGQPPELWNLPQGCSFQPRCEWAVAACAETPGPFVEIGTEHWVECREAVAKTKAINAESGQSNE